MGRALLLVIVFTLLGDVIKSMLRMPLSGHSCFFCGVYTLWFVLVYLAEEFFNYDLKY